MLAACPWMESGGLRVDAVILASKKGSYQQLFDHVTEGPPSHGGLVQITMVALALGPTHLPG